MRRRWRLLTGVALLLLVGVVLSFPAVHWRLIGLAKGEAFFQGRPTSWWARELQRIDWVSLLSSQVQPDPMPVCVPEFARSLWSSDPMRGLALLDPKPPEEAVPVLIELLRHDDESVRGLAADVLRRFAPEEAAKAGIIDP